MAIEAGAWIEPANLEVCGDVDPRRTLRWLHGALGLLETPASGFGRTSRWEDWRRTLGADAEETCHV
jgi:hypothetical protein